MKYKAKEGVSHFYSRFNSLNIVIMFKCKWYIGFMTHFENKWIYLLKYFTILYDIRWNWDMAIYRYTDICIYSKYSRQKPASLHHQLINAWRTLLEKIHDIQMLVVRPHDQTHPQQHTNNRPHWTILINIMEFRFRPQNNGRWNSFRNFKKKSSDSDRHKTFANIL